MPYSGLAADVWSSGVILYALLARQLPFDHEHIPTLLELIKRGKFEWQKCIPNVARDLIGHMLEADTSKRFSVRFCFAALLFLHARQRRSRSEFDGS